MFITTCPCVTLVFPAEKPPLIATRTEDFINFLLKFYKLYALGSLRAFCYRHKMGGNVAGCQHPKRAFLTALGEVNNKIFLLINEKSTVNHCFYVAG